MFICAQKGKSRGKCSKLLFTGSVSVSLFQIRSPEILLCGSEAVKTLFLNLIPAAFLCPLLKHSPIALCLSESLIALPFCIRVRSCLTSRGELSTNICLQSFAPRVTGPPSFLCLRTEGKPFIYVSIYGLSGVSEVDRSEG